MIKIRESKLFTSIASLVSGKSAAAAISLLLTPFIARLFSTDDFGVTAIFVSIVMVSAAVSSLGFNRAVVIAKSKQDAVLLFQLSLWTIVIFCILALMFLVLLSIFGVEILLLSQLESWRWLLPIAILSYSLVLLMESWLTHESDFGTIAKSSIVNQLLLSTTRLSSGYFIGAGPGALIVTYVISLWASISIMLRKRTQNFELKKALGHWPSLRTAVTDYRDFPLYNLPSSLVFIVSVELPIFVLGFLYDPSIVGLYAMSNRLIQAPLRIVADAVRTVFTKHTADLLSNHHDIIAPTLKLFAVLLLSGLPIFGLIYCYAKPVADLLLGSNWAGIDQFIKALLPWLFMVWITVPFSTTFVVLRKQAIWLRIQILLLFARVAVFYYAYLSSQSALETIQMYVFVTVLVQVGIILIGYYLVRDKSTLES